jgi:hypothetical protein
MAFWSFDDGTWHPPFFQQLQFTVKLPREYGSLNVSNSTDGEFL